ncbi:MAG: Crp/Fnr family transcriptional regulator [Enhydrobacter sp.]|nr:MAG: Crp/Fnr family transcriptional regulator [Enhydrobacter sp.]
MNDSTTIRPSNAFLAALPARDFAELRPHLRLVEIGQGDVLCENGAPIGHVLFVESGMISLVTTMRDGRAVENATLGKEAVFGALSALGAHRANVRAVMQIAGCVWRVRVEDFREVFERSAAVRRLVLLASELSIAQMQQTAACNALHQAPQRLCRWILQVHDRIDGRHVELTHEFLAQMLALRRPTVSLILQELQGAGLVRYGRGRITVLDRDGLESRACECAQVLRDKLRRTLAAMR